MSHTHDWIERVRAVVLPAIGIIVQYINDVTGSAYYVRSNTHANQFVGRVNMNEESFERKLHEMGFVRNPLSSWKRLATTDEEMEGSWRLVENEDQQLHVVLYDGSKIADAATGHTYVYAHLEKRWDVHPIDHYNGVGFNANKGATRMKDLLDQNGIVYEPIRP